MAARTRGRRATAASSKPPAARSAASPQTSAGAHREWKGPTPQAGLHPRRWCCFPWRPAGRAGDSRCGAAPARPWVASGTAPERPERPRSSSAPLPCRRCPVRFPLRTARRRAACRTFSHRSCKAAPAAASPSPPPPASATCSAAPARAKTPPPTPSRRPRRAARACARGRTRRRFRTARWWRPAAAAAPAGSASPPCEAAPPPGRPSPSPAAPARSARSTWTPPSEAPPPEAPRSRPRPRPARTRSRSEAPARWGRSTARSRGTTSRTAPALATPCGHSSRPHRFLPTPSPRPRKRPHRRRRSRRLPA
mmetsp:Transcript_33387/g.72074  ORF Transcript_33387/g.72074 Transcript_33387/m.72074 type:complete len:309 (+) Transcript_33387:313-1239(+)